jgi:transaldolase
MSHTPLHQLVDLGQSPWLDFIRRDMIQNGEMAALRDKGIRGVTSNPAIFEQAIAQSNVYDDAINALASQGKSALEIYDDLSVEDVQMAADVFRSVYDESHGEDGYVSLEVSPLLAHDTNATIADAHRLWKRVDRPNVMIKIPATLAGVPAIKQCLTDGININVTLLFGLDRYKAIIDAYIEALEERSAKARPLQVASVASFFVSRVDTLLDPQLTERGLNHLVGKLAVANARAAFFLYQDAFEHARFKPLWTEGAPVQRVLWASTSSKNPAFSPIKYVEELVGPATVNTMPLATINAYLESGQPQDTVSPSRAEAEATLADAAANGIDMEAIAMALEADAVQKFVDPFHKLIDSIEAKRTAIV